MAIGWFTRSIQVKLTPEGSDFHLCLPNRNDYDSWHYSRALNRANLQPFEPSWAEHALTRTTFNRFVRQAHSEMRSERGAVFFLKNNADGAVIGGINLRNIRRGSADMGTIGYWIVSQYGRAGRMKAAVGAVVDFGFREFDLHRVEAACVPENEASARVLLANGFEEEGFARAYLKIDGRWRDHRLFAIVNPHA